MQNLCGQTLTLFSKKGETKTQKHIKVHAISKDRLYYHATDTQTGENELVSRTILDAMFLTKRTTVKPEHTKGMNPNRRVSMAEGMTVRG